ncbi:unnamed protein product [Nezara viridula]|uniref:Uncharacterized protein n=1 Tax=Nezara viridula TaxID=85310 RepID=A0A9P0H843_NEZVI|nr:unnamed protein product [Nezara viridula]
MTQVLIPGMGQRGDPDSASRTAGQPSHVPNANLVRIPPDGILGKDKTYFSSFRTAVDSNQNNWGHTTGEHLTHDHYVCNRRTAKRPRPPAHVVIA